jgi:hypothetical protein
MRLFNPAGFKRKTLYAPYVLYYLHKTQECKQEYEADARPVADKAKSIAESWRSMTQEDRDIMTGKLQHLQPLHLRDPTLQALHDNPY